MWKLSQEKKHAYLRRLDIEARVWISLLHGNQADGCLFLWNVNVGAEVISDEVCEYAGVSRW